MIFYADLGMNVDVDKVDDLETRVDQLLEALGDLEDADTSIVDVDITATLSTGEITVNTCLQADDLAEAGQKLVATVRTALHQIGDGTAGWERLAQMVHEACMNVRASGVRELADA